MGYHQILCLGSETGFSLERSSCLTCIYHVALCRRRRVCSVYVTNQNLQCPMYMCNKKNAKFKDFTLCQGACKHLAPFFKLYI